MADAKTNKGPAAAPRASDIKLTDTVRSAIEEYRRQRSRSARPDRRAKKDDARGEADVLAKIAQLDEADRSMAERVHAIVKATAPELAPRTWYGSPAYYRDGSLICYFQERAKFKARYAVLGFSDKAHLDDGPMWPIMYALTEMTPAVEATIIALLKKAVD